jgi:hypothetical protein
MRRRVLSGAEQIVVERWRQVYVLGWTSEHDAAQPEGALIREALRYIDRATDALSTGDGPGRIEALVKAGAMLAAEVDRLADVSLDARD